MKRRKTVRERRPRLLWSVCLRITASLKILQISQRIWLTGCVFVHRDENKGSEAFWKSFLPELLLYMWSDVYVCESQLFWNWGCRHSML